LIRRMARRSRNSHKRKRSGLGGRLLALCVAGLALAVAAAWLVMAPFGPGSETFVLLPSGASSPRLAAQLESAGIVRSRYAFEAVHWWKRGRLKAGEYRFDHAASVLDVYRRIARGDVFTHPVTFPEGSNIFEMGARLEQAGILKQQDFLDAARSQTALIADLDPGAKSLEGYLFPDTYNFPHASAASQVCALMVKRFREVAARIGLQGDAHHFVTLAALVERESAIPSERPLVASVFENRLAKNMPLGTDPSVIYGLELEGRWRGAIYASDLKSDTPYNTYLHAGLPPGPVANPGAQALRAALNPAHTGYLYFVAAGADPQGHSLFAATLEEHNHNVTLYRHATRTEAAFNAAPAANTGRNHKKAGKS